MEEQKSSRGNGSSEAAKSRRSFKDYITEILAILVTGSLPLSEPPGFIAWLITNGGRI